MLTKFLGPALFVLLIATDTIHAEPPAGTPKVVMNDLRRDTDPKFNRKEREMIFTARHYVEEKDKQPVDAYYKLTTSGKGYEVYMLFVSGYQGNKPFFTPGNFCSVSLDKAGKVLRLTPGA